MRILDSVREVMATSSILDLWPLVFGPGAFGLWPLVFGLGVLFGYPETKVPQGQSPQTKGQKPKIQDLRSNLFSTPRLPPQCRRCSCPNLYWTKIQVDHLYRVGSARGDGRVDHRNTVRAVGCLQ